MLATTWGNTRSAADTDPEEKAGDGRHQRPHPSTHEQSSSTALQGRAENGKLGAWEHMGGPSEESMQQGSDGAGTATETRGRRAGKTAESTHACPIL